MEFEHYDRHQYHLKGQNAEQFLHALAIQSFFTDWCFPSPKWPDGKELCDLLVVYDNIAIIWQAKDLKLDADGRYNANEVEKNVRQLAGARRKLFDLKTPIDLQNVRRRPERLDPSTITEVYLISALLGEGEGMVSMMDTVKDHAVHIFTRDFTEIGLTELDTISDFTSYLRTKERFIREKQGNLMIQGGEEELLAYYLKHNRSFEALIAPAFTMIDEGHWRALQTHRQYVARQKANEISYGWDSMIDRAHEEGTAEYERIARELARPNRFERRGLATSFREAAIIAHKGDAPIFRRMGYHKGDTPAGGTTYCFLFFDEQNSREHRAVLLKASCVVARGRILENTRVVGIATERHIAALCSYDFLLLEIPEWTEKHQQDMEFFQNQLDIGGTPTFRETDEKEFPDAPPSVR